MPLVPSDDWLAEVKARVVELPLARKQRFMSAYQLPPQDAQSFVDDAALGDYFERAAAGAKNPKAVANWVINNLRASLSETGTPVEETRIPPHDISGLVALVDSGRISGRMAQDVFAEMFATGSSPGEIVEAKGMTQVSDASALEQFCDQAIAANPGPAADFRAGKAAALNFLKGQVMKLSKGKANPALVGEILERKLRA
jgi:aspartyl-tRNA(Asn)/glutamyl-tRNA(Gln) amidotransferase subunit B